jgi:hypothetical protein
MSVISALIKEAADNCLASSIFWGHSKKLPSMNQGTGPYQTANLPVTWSGFPNLENCEKLISVVYKPSSLWYFDFWAWIEWNTDVAEEEQILMNN